MKKIILQNKDFGFSEFVKGWDSEYLYLTKKSEEAYNFSSAEEAEKMRLDVQEVTGNRWQVEIIENED